MKIHGNKIFEIRKIHLKMGELIMKIQWRVARNSLIMFKGERLMYQ